MSVIFAALKDDSVINDPSKRLRLEVPDADSREEFLTHAREVWNKHHPDRQKERGRPYDARISVVLKEVLHGWGTHKTPPSIKHLTKLVDKKFNNEAYMAEKFKEDQHPAASDTIRRYAKLTLILMKWAREDGERNIRDVEWISGNVPASQEAVTEIIDTVSAILPDVSRVIESLGNIPRLVNESGMHMTAARMRALQRTVLAFQGPTHQSGDKLDS